MQQHFGVRGGLSDNALMLTLVACLSRSACKVLRAARCPCAYAHPLCLRLNACLKQRVYVPPAACRHFTGSSRFSLERAVPAALLQHAAGYAVLSVLRVGCGWSAAVGTGLVVSRLEGGGWSPPSAIGLGSCGWGMQAGGQLTDLLLVLPNKETVKV